jgi:hypothetical protein
MDGLINNYEPFYFHFFVTIFGDETVALVLAEQFRIVNFFSAYDGLLRFGCYANVVFNEGGVPDFSFLGFGRFVDDTHGGVWMWQFLLSSLEVGDDDMGMRLFCFGVSRRSHDSSVWIDG